MPVTGTITKTINIAHTIDDSIDVPGVNIQSGTNSFPTLTQTVTDGTAAGQANKVYRSYRTLTAGANETLDLSGSLTNFHGDVVAFTGVKSLTIAIVAPDGTKKLTVGNAASNSFQGPLSASSTQDVHYDMEWKNWSAAGYAVANGSTDNLKIANPGASSVIFCIAVIGI